MITNRFSLLIVALLAVGLPYQIEAHANTILPSNSEVIIGVNGVITESNLSFATDGVISTGYLVESTNSPNNNSLLGFAVRWDFDISGYTAVTEFTFSMTGVLTNPPLASSAFDELWIGSQPIANVDKQSAPSGQSVFHEITATIGGANFENLSNYIVGNTLSVFVQTKFGSSTTGGPLSLLTQEVSGDITGTQLSAVPLPAAFPLFAGGLGLLGLLGWRRKRMAST